MSTRDVLWPTDTAFYRVNHKKCDIFDNNLANLTDFYSFYIILIMN